MLLCCRQAVSVLQAAMSPNPWDMAFPLPLLGACCCTTAVSCMFCSFPAAGSQMWRRCAIREVHVQMLCCPSCHTTT